MTNPRKVLIGARASVLSMRQVETARDQIRAVMPEAWSIETVRIMTMADRPQAGPGDGPAEGTDWFSKEIEQALADGRMDIAVHSLKDLPAVLAPGLAVGAILERGDAREALVSREGKKLDKLPRNARIGTSSPRRGALLLRARKDLRIVPVRGNVDTRLRKLRTMPLDAIVVSWAALQRLGRFAEVTEILDLEQFPPAPGQAAIAIECRGDDTEVLDVVSRIDHAPTRFDVIAERSLLHHLGGGCRIPVAAFARTQDGLLHLKAVVLSIDGDRTAAGERSGDPARAADIGANLARELLACGGNRILENIRRAETGK